MSPQTLFLIERKHQYIHWIVKFSRTCFGPIRHNDICRKLGRTAKKTFMFQNFHWIVQVRKSGGRVEEVAIFQNNRDMINNVRSQMVVEFDNSQSYGLNKSSIGRIRTVKCKAENEKVIEMVAICISPYQ